MPDPVLEQVVTASSGASTGSSATLTFTTTASIAAGRLLVVAANKGATVGAQGIASIAVSAGAVSGWTRGASAVRASTHDVQIMATLVTTTIPSGSTVTVTWTVAGIRRAGVFAVFTEVTSKTSETSSSTATGGAETVSVGSNGSGSLMTTTATAVNTSADALVLAAFSEGGTAQPVTIGSNLTTVGEIITTVGSGDRGVILTWRVARAPVTQSAATTLAASAVWAAALATYPITAPSGGATPVTSVVVGGAKKPVSSISVIVGGVKRPVSSVSAIVGGVKKPVS